MSWGSEQNYEITQIKTLLNPPLNEYQNFFVLYGCFYRSYWILLVAFIFLMFSLEVCWTSFIQMVASVCLYIPTPGPVHSAGLNLLSGTKDAG